MTKQTATQKITTSVYEGDSNHPLTKEDKIKSIKSEMRRQFDHIGLDQITNVEFTETAPSGFVITLIAEVTYIIDDERVSFDVTGYDRYYNHTGITMERARELFVEYKGITFNVRNNYNAITKRNVRYQTWTLSNAKTDETIKSGKF